MIFSFKIPITLTKKSYPLTLNTYLVFKSNNIKFINTVYTSGYKESSLTRAIQFSPVRWKVTSAILFHIFVNYRTNINLFIENHILWAIELYMVCIPGAILNYAISH